MCVDTQSGWQPDPRREGFTYSNFLICYFNIRRSGYIRNKAGATIKERDRLISFHVLSFPFKPKMVLFSFIRSAELGVR